MATVSKTVQPGDMVWLRSGGPAMMVTSLLRSDNLVTVEWFDRYEIKRDAFDPENLTLTRPFGKAR